MILPPLSSRLVSVTVTFVLKAINLQTIRYRELPDCYDFTVIVCDMTRFLIFKSEAPSDFTNNTLIRTLKDDGLVL